MMAKDGLEGAEGAARADAALDAGESPDGVDIGYEAAMPVLQQLFVHGGAEPLPPEVVP